MRKIIKEDRIDATISMLHIYLLKEFIGNVNQDNAYDVGKALALSFQESDNEIYNVMINFAYGLFKELKG